MHILEGHVALVKSVPDGVTLAPASADSAMWLWVRVGQ